MLFRSVLATDTAYPFPAKHLESSAALARARIERAHAGLERCGRVLVVGADDMDVELDDNNGKFKGLQVYC